MSGDSGFWLSAGEKNAMGFFMVQQGFDVWLGNNRGNRYSKAHTNPKISQYDYYQMSFENYGIYDIPGFYQKIFEFYQDKDQKIIYMAHSQGNSQMFAGLLDSRSKAYLIKHTERFFAFAPIVFMTKIDKTRQGAAKTFSPLYNVADWLSWAIDIYWIGDKYGGSPLYAALHYAQLIAGDKGKPVFRKYDYGWISNKYHYGCFGGPPEWNLGDFPKSVPLTMQGNSDDDLASPANLDDLLDHLGRDYYKIDYVEGWGHNNIFANEDKTPIYNIIKRDLDLG